MSATIVYFLGLQDFIALAPEHNEPLTLNFDWIKEKKQTQLLFVGDMMFDRGIRYYAQKNGEYDFVLEEISKLLLGKNLVIGNLEGPVTDYQSKSINTGVGNPNNFVFTFDPRITKTLFDNNIRAVTLGNNHISNFGREGIVQTKKYLDEQKIAHFGSPDGPRSASVELNNIRITFVAYNEFSYPPEPEAPAAIDEIKKVKNLSDIVIVYAHWGLEYKQEPRDSDRKLAHQFIDAGADLVIGGHPHVIQSIETYKDKKIYYSLGNFIFDQYWGENTQTSLGVVVKINPETKELDFEEVKFYLEPNGQTRLNATIEK